MHSEKVNKLFGTISPKDFSFGFYANVLLKCKKTITVLEDEKRHYTVYDGDELLCFGMKYDDAMFKVCHYFSVKDESFFSVFVEEVIRKLKVIDNELIGKISIHTKNSNELKEKIKKIKFML